MIFFSRKYDFWSVYETIKKFYPVGIVVDWETLHHCYEFDYPGRKHLEAIIIENTHDQVTFKNQWTTLSEEIGRSVEKEVIGTTYGRFPSYSACITLEKITNDNFTHIKEILVFVSFLGPYYSIIGVDRSEINLEGRKKHIPNYLVASPLNEFEATFKAVEFVLAGNFPGHAFVPFEVCRQCIQGLSIRGANDEHLNAVFHALFDEDIDLQTTCIGDTFYGSDRWTRAYIK